MFEPASKIKGHEVHATDGNVGSVADLLFDDHQWTVRWAVIDTGSWLPGRKVIVPPSVLGRPDWSARAFNADVSREKIEASPGIDADKPVSRQQESDVFDYHGWTPYCGAVPAAAAGDRENKVRTKTKNRITE